jgi:hypothetical protein
MVIAIAILGGIYGDGIPSGEFIVTEQDNSIISETGDFLITE